MNNGIISTIAATGLAMLVGCSQEPVTEPDPLGDESVATIDGAPVQAVLFNHYSRGRLQKDAESLSDDEYDALIEELIEFRLLARAAEAEGLLSDEELAAQLEIQRLQSLARAMASSYLEDNPTTEAELLLAYQQNLSQLSGPQYKARHILVDTEEEADAAIEELQQGADFEELAINRSTGPSGPNGGDLGWFTAETMVGPFAEAVRNMEIGTFSEAPVATRFGWHVILLEDSADQEPPGLAAVRDEITSYVEQRRVAEYLESLRDASVIVVGESGTN
jgi:peptidyl-prolyl cis-trans isomerase C